MSQAKITKKLVSQGNYVAPKLDFIPHESITEQTGHIPAELQIKRLIESGARLNDYRRFVYDFSDIDKIDLDKVQPDPTREVGFGLDDIHYLKQKIIIAQKEKEYFNKELVKKVEEDDQEEAQKPESSDDKNDKNKDEEK